MLKDGALTMAPYGLSEATQWRQRISAFLAACRQAWADAAGAHSTFCLLHRKSILLPEHGPLPEQHLRMWLPTQSSRTGHCLDLAMCGVQSGIPVE